jgi:hypothetical protein
LAPPAILRTRRFSIAPSDGEAGNLNVPVVGVAKAGWNLDQLRARAKDSLEKHGGLDTAAFEKLIHLLYFPTDNIFCTSGPNCWFLETDTITAATTDTQIQVWTSFQVGSALFANYPPYSAAQTASDSTFPAYGNWNEITGLPVKIPRTRLVPPIRAT